MIDATLACKDANSKFVEVVTVADVDDEDRVCSVGGFEAEVWVRCAFGNVLIVTLACL